MTGCPICGAYEGWRVPHGLDPRIEGWRREAADTAPYFWTLCKVCGNAYPSVPPRPEVLARFWETNRRLETLSPEEQDAVWRQRIAMGRVIAERSWQLFAPLAGGKTGRMLDVGCGLGEAVALFGERGWRAEGIDVDASTKPFHERIGIATRIGRIEDEPTGVTYDIVHIAHAIYFVTDPMRFLREARQRLSEGGHLCIVISNLLTFTDSGRPGYSHTFYPCAESMAGALARAGLEPVLSRVWGGSTYIAARACEPRVIPVDTHRIHRRYLTKPLRFGLIGRPYLALRRIAAAALKGKRG